MSAYKNDPTKPTNELHTGARGRTTRELMREAIALFEAGEAFQEELQHFDPRVELGDYLPSVEQSWNKVQNELQLDSGETPTQMFLEVEQASEEAQTIGTLHPHLAVISNGIPHFEEQVASRADSPSRWGPLLFSLSLARGTTPDGYVGSMGQTNSANSILSSDVELSLIEFRTILNRVPELGWIGDVAYVFFEQEKNEFVISVDRVRYTEALSLSTTGSVLAVVRDSGDEFVSLELSPARPMQIADARRLKGSPTDWFIEFHMQP